MKKHVLPVALFIGWMGAGFLSLSAQQGAAPPPDNTKVNKQAGLTADQQSQTKEDLALVAEIRKTVVADKTLSTNAHNCKIITRDGTVTLRGPVNSAKEKTRVAEIATKIAGTGKVTNLLAVASSK